MVEGVVRFFEEGDGGKDKTGGWRRPDCDGPVGMFVYAVCEVLDMLADAGNWGGGRPYDR